VTASSCHVEAVIDSRSKSRRNIPGIVMWSPEEEVHHLSGFAEDGDARVLGDLALFAGCSPEQLHRIASLTTITDVSPGRTLCRQGAPGREFFAVVDGEATVTIDGTDVGTMGSGCGFGEIALLTPEGRRTATVTAATAMTLVVLNRVQFAQLFDVAPVVARRILQDSATRLARNARSRRIVASP
jgi:CRP/FNR family transcriptional regulator, cyclic AMP receptor protein